MVKDPPVTEEERRAIKTLFVSDIKEVVIDDSKIGAEKAADIKSELTNVEDCFGLLHNMKEKRCQDCKLKVKYKDDKFVEFNQICEHFMKIRPKVDALPPLLDDGKNGKNEDSKDQVATTAKPSTKPARKSKVSKEERKELIFENIKGGMTDQYKLADKIGISANLANILLRDLITEKLIKREKKGRGYTYLPV